MFLKPKVIHSALLLGFSWHLFLARAHTLLLALLAAHHDPCGLNVARPNETVLGFVLLSSIDAVVGECEACAFAPTEARLHAKNHSGLGNGLVALALDRYSAIM